MNKNIRIISNVYPVADTIQYRAAHEVWYRINDASSRQNAIDTFGVYMPQ